MTDIAEQIADAIQRTRETTGACTRSDLRCWGFTDAEIEAHAPYDDPPLPTRAAERILREQAAAIERLRAEEAVLIKANDRVAEDRGYTSGDGHAMCIEIAAAALAKASKP